ncbi:hypothetical protein VN97_g10283 [Penicillium thymicola]|uniref:Uncharacterized protein n=1 Tax=Penicillium thymicola TaxID=293382 RepID=A0AAI9TA31_PENTH|nr:hypothetical protein VN97_g10283 [Penicillium thymicola]
MLFPILRSTVLPSFLYLLKSKLSATMDLRNTIVRASNLCGVPGLVGRHLKAHLPTDWATTYLGHHLTLHFSLHAPNIEGCANFDSHGNLMLQSLRTKKKWLKPPPIIHSSTCWKAW